MTFRESILLALILLLALGGWSYLLQKRLDQQDKINDMLLNRLTTLEQKKTTASHEHE